MILDGNCEIYGACGIDDEMLDSANATSIAAANPIIINEAYGNICMNGGGILVRGAKSTAIRNENSTVGEAVINGGIITVTNAESTAIDNQGILSISDEAEIDATIANEYLITVSFGEGGTVMPNTNMAKAGSQVTYKAIPEYGYQVANAVYS